MGKQGNREGGSLLLDRSRHGSKQPLLDLSVHMMTGVADFDRVEETLLVPEISPVWGLEARVEHGELEQPSRVPDTMSCGHDPLSVRNVHPLKSLMGSRSLTCGLRLTAPAGEKGKPPLQPTPGVQQLLSLITKGLYTPEQSHQNLELKRKE
jgi:hypothetical protein